MHESSPCILCHFAATIAPPQLQFSLETDSGLTFVLTQATAERSERYISSFECTGLRVPLEVEFKETQSRSTQGDVVTLSALTPGAVCNQKMWSINGASFSYAPLAATNLLFDKGKELQ